VFATVPPRIEVNSSLITGVTGFVGRALALELMARGHAFRALVRGENPERRVAEAGIQADVVAGDLRDAASLRRAVQGSETVVHLAAAVDPRKRVDPKERFLTNVEAAVELARLAREQAARRFVFASSISAMGFWSGTATAQSPCRPRGAYGVGKLEAERRLLALAAPGFDVTVLRFPVMYGAGDRFMFLSWVQAVDRGLFRVIGSGDNAFPLCSAENAAHTLCAAIEGRLAGGVYLVADAEAYSVSRIYRAIAAALGRVPARMHVPVSLAVAAARLNQSAARWLGVPLWLNPESVRELIVDQRFDLTPLRRQGIELRADLEAGTRATIDDYRQRGVLRNRIRSRAD
jgi:UDP-glucose 4-epimerase